MVDDTKAGNCDTGVGSRTGVQTPSKEIVGPYRGSLGLSASLGNRGVEKWPRINNSRPGHEYLSERIRLALHEREGSIRYSYQRDASDTVANDIKELYSEAREIVAQFLMTTIEGAEVIEIKSISTTSLIASVCSDIMVEDFVVVPYACLGLGVI
ncbi:surface antigen family protein [Anaplasma phagocytophilum str. ApNP]|uniref:Surface antigen family protein n=1 Tax=Anaplasma phagocytophilum str. ApNP TaxID=1359153 RepID=A0A0F3NGJ6_ANAPH|nr:surface antigen family protein [Anaplasma phagocytophilum str. ApNP]